MLQKNTIRPVQKCVHQTGKLSMKLDLILKENAVSRKLNKESLFTKPKQFVDSKELIWFQY